MPSATIQPDLARNGSSLDAGSNDGVSIVRDMRLLRLEGLQRGGVCPLFNLGYKFLRVIRWADEDGHARAALLPSIRSVAALVSFEPVKLNADGSLRFRVLPCRERRAHHA